MSDALTSTLPNHHTSNQIDCGWVPSNLLNIHSAITQSESIDTDDNKIIGQMYCLLIDKR